MVKRKKLTAVREWLSERPDHPAETAIPAGIEVPEVVAPDETRRLPIELADKRGVRIEPIVIGDPSPVVEPVPVDGRFRTVPHRPDTVTDGWATASLLVRGASLRGHVHRFDGAPRQDEMAVHALASGRIIVAVADGVSSALHAHIGAAASVRQAVQWVVNHAANVGDEVDWNALVAEAAWAIVVQARAILGEDDPDLTEVEQQFATTLVVAVIDPNPDGSATARFSGVGDSGAWVLRGDGTFDNVLGGKHANAAGLSSSAVAGLPRRPGAVEALETIIGVGETFLVGTDGIGDPLGSGVGGVGDLFRDLLHSGAPSLIEFAHAVDFSRVTFDDDRTLVAVQPRQTAAEPT